MASDKPELPVYNSLNLICDTTLIVDLYNTHVAWELHAWFMITAGDELEVKCSKQQ